MRPLEDIWTSIRSYNCRHGDEEEQGHELLDELIVFLVELIQAEFLPEFRRSIFDWQWQQMQRTVAEWPVPTRDSFDWLGRVGKGGYATVFAVQCKRTGHVYAMKRIDKRLIKQKKQQKAVELEKQLMAQIKSPFVAGLHCSYQDETHVTLGMDMIAGGDIEAYMTRKGPFPESVVKYLMAEIILGLKHLHERGIMHRDIKPANVLVTHDGHAVLSDLGLVTFVQNPSLQCLLLEIEDAGAGGSLSHGHEIQYGDFTVRKSPHGTVYVNGNRIKPHARGKAGTPGFWAPEMLRRDNDGRPGKYTGTADWWSIGCLLYAMLLGVGPFTVLGGDTNDDNNETLNGSVVLPHGRIGADARSLIAQLLVRDPAQRLGNKGAWEVMAHPFFEGVEWALLEARTLPPPWRPPLGVVNAQPDVPGEKE